MWLKTGAMSDLNQCTTILCVFRKGTGVADNTNNGPVLSNRPSEPWPCDSEPQYQASESDS